MAPLGVYVDQKSLAFPGLIMQGSRDTNHDLFDSRYMSTQIDDSPGSSHGCIRCLSTDSQFMNYSRCQIKIIYLLLHQQTAQFTANVIKT